MRLHLIPDPELHPQIYYSPLLDLAILTLRCLSSAIFGYYLLSEQISLAFQHLLNGEDWSMATFLAELGLPRSGLFATAFVVITGFAVIGMIVGFFTRLCALFLAVTMGAILISTLSVSPTVTPQSTLLYLCIYLGIVVGGAGRISLDALLLGRKSQKEDSEVDF